MTEKTSPAGVTPITLTIDIGGQGIKGRPFRSSSQAIGERLRLKTPRPANAEAILHTTVQLAEKMRPFDRVSVGFPGVVVDGVVRTAPNLDGRWKGVHFQDRLAHHLGTPVKVINDADMQGFGAIAGKGVEMMVTLGTGVGGALFLDGRLLPNLELGHHPFEREETYEQRLGQAALDAEGRTQWNRRLARAIELLERIFNFRMLYLGGGNARCVNIPLPKTVTVVKNEVALAGGVALWEAPA